MFDTAIHQTTTLMEPSLQLEVVFTSASCAERVVACLDVAALYGHAAEPLRQVSRRWCAVFSDGPALWRELFVRRWPTAKSGAIAGPARDWRALYVARHRGEISPDPLTRPVKRNRATSNFGGEDGAFTHKRKREERIPGAPPPPLTPFFAFMARERAAMASGSGGHGGAGASDSSSGGGGGSGSCDGGTAASASAVGAMAVATAAASSIGAPTKPVAMSKVLGLRWRALGAAGQAPFHAAFEASKVDFHISKGEFLVARRRVARVKQLPVLLALVRLTRSWSHRHVRAWLDKGAWKPGLAYGLGGKFGAAAVRRAAADSIDHRIVTAQGN